MPLIKSEQIGCTTIISKDWQQLKKAENWLFTSTQSYIAFLKGAASTLDPTANSRKNDGIQDPPILWHLEFKNLSVGTQPTIRKV
jgi:hypothetical protein